ncbi:hypothetical protein R3P38DRAFT_3465532 [Favolaschia claudopus]|uniref:F-box domain-containing protein n=1 Tax=Favolaschia claudopus TaxID=2862362 RepID=A0AAV9ZEZ7_9AGAR
MPAPCLPVLELWDHIIDLTPADAQKAMSLACRSFVPPAQRNLFREISIHDDAWVWQEGSCRMISGALTGLQLATRLASLLSSAPHLLTYIRELKLDSRHEECYTILAAIPWSNLRALFLQTVVQIRGPAGDAISILMRTPSLRSLEIRPSKYGSGARQGAASEWIEHIVHSCSSHIESLKLFGCFLTDAITTSRHIQGPGTRPRAKIQHLSIQTCQGTADLLIRALDFTSLKSFQCDECWTPDVLQLLQRFGQTVESVVLSPNGINFIFILHSIQYFLNQITQNRQLDRVDLASLFPSLNAITALSLPCAARQDVPMPIAVPTGHPQPYTAVPPPPPAMFNPMLARLPLTNKISRVVFSIHVFELCLWRPPVVPKYFPEFENVVLMSLQGLRVVEVEVDMKVDPGHSLVNFLDGLRTYDAIASRIYDAFPRLYEEKLLTVSLRNQP